MIKYVTVLSRRAGMGREEFSSYWKNTHAPPTPKETSRPTTGSANSTSTAWKPCKRGLAARKVRRLLPISPTSATREKLVRVFVEEVKFV